MQFRVFPASLINGQKVPLIRGWNEAATNDPVQIQAWVDQFRDRLHFFGIPCGQVNGIFVLDIDVKKVNGFESLKKLGYELPPTLEQNTPSGGKHVFFKTHPNVHYPNSVNSNLGLDTRGDRGWVAFYNFSNDLPIAEAPQWLFELVSKQKTTNEVSKSSIKIAPEIAQKVFEEAIQNIINAPEGESNNVLNISSYKVGQLVASNALTREYAEIELFRAAKQRGKPDYESRATINSGLDGGCKHPLTSPFGEFAPSPSFSIPEPPGQPERWTPSYLTRTDLLNTSKLRKPQLFQDWSSEDISITTADGGTGKTTIKLYEAICLALGERFLGFDCKQRGRTLYITGEDTAAKLGAMIGTILNQMGLFVNTPENNAKVDCVLQSIVIKKDADLCLISKTKDHFLMPNSQAMEKLMHAVEDLKPKMIVFDPISSFWGSEAALNDMNKAVTRFMSDLVERSGACVEMINHMGKSSSANKDMSQFAGRGGSGLPSNSRISRVLRSLSQEEFGEMTGSELMGDQTAMLCNVNKFSDGSPLMNKPFIILRNGFLFSRITLSPQQVKQLEKELDDKEKIFTFVAECRRTNKYPTRDVCIAHFMNNGSPMSAGRITRALNLLAFEGHLGQKVVEVDHPDLRIRQKALVITDMSEKEL